MTKTTKEKKVAKIAKTSKIATAKTPKTAHTTEATIYNTKGASVGTAPLPEKIFGLPWNADLVHQVMHSMMSSARQPIAHTKTRGEVRGGGKKPWRQKGTGRARHGSTRSPLWIGGGVAHGPRKDKNYDRKINKTMKTKAFMTLLSKKWKDGEILFVDSLSFSSPKTTEAKTVLVSLAKVAGFEKLSTKPKNAVFISLAKKDINVEKSFRNIGSVSLDETRNLNLLDVLNHKFIIIENPVESMKALENKIQ
ncbi:MAG: 50S ribosomal protein L4 [Patescibacteria group bacterium]